MIKDVRLGKCKKKKLLSILYHIPSASNLCPFKTPYDIPPGYLGV